jgi:hypothetical protein
MFQINHVKRTVLSVVLGAIVVAVSVLSGVMLTHAQSSGDCRTFPETGHKVCGKFLTYWDSHGGLAQQGFPISETFTENSPLDGKPYTVQYFERAVFELHPENQPPYDVLLSQLGTFVAKQKYTQGFPATGGVPFYEDRLDPMTFIESFYNAINRKEYVRAYSYWEPAAAATQLPAYPQFEQGYAATQAVNLTLGQVSGDAGAGQRYYSVPVTIVSKQAGSKTQPFVGCYTLHLANPQIQAAPPFQPLSISAANIQAVPANTTAAALLSQVCP